MTTDTAELGGLPPAIEARLYDALFDVADPAERDAAVEALCVEHEDQRAAIRTRWAHILRGDVVTSAIAGAVREPRDGDSIGPYRLVRELGRGGFGVVWLAEQELPIRRRIALKLLLPETASPRALLRFEAERDALARMSHSNIARVFDAGTAGGHTFIAMELVEGEPITDWCDARGATIADRLRLFLRVCSGVHHAHQQGVLHRDLKPSNILVVEEDGAPVPKIIDFGVAKSVEGVSDVATRTESGRIVGTPEYMSPEQAAGLPVDTRTDIHALGVLLFELLTGCLPFDPKHLRGGGLARMIRAIAEDEPRRPSEALASSTGAHDAAAARRSLRRRELVRRLRGDLDQVVGKALEKDRDARYGAVSELAAEIERVLHDQPVLARRPELRYLLAKFVRRHRVGVAVGALFGVALVAGAIGTVWALVEIDAARARAEASRADAELAAYVANLASAKAAVEHDDAAGALRRLDACPPALRGWEWRHLRASCDTSRRAWPIGRPLRALAAPPDGPTVVAATADSVLWLHLGDGEPRETARVADTNAVLARSPRDDVVAVASELGALALYGASNGELIRRVWSGPDALRSVAFTPDGERVAFGDDDGVVRIADCDGDRIVELRGGHEGAVWSMCFSPSGDGLATGGLDGRVVSWQIAIGEPREHVRHDDHVRCVRFDASGTRLISASRRGAVAVTAAANGQTLAGFDCGTAIWEIAPGRDGAHLWVVGGYAGQSLVATFDLETGARLGTHVGHVAPVVAIVARDRDVLTASHDGRLRTWPGAVRSRPELLASGRSTCGIAVLGADLVTAASRGVVVRWRGDDRARLWQREIAGGISVLAADPAGQRLFVVTRREWSGPVVVLDAASGGEVGTLPGAGAAISDLECGGDPAHVAVARFDGTVRLFVAADARPALELPVHDGSVAVAMAGDRIATGDASGTVRSWRLSDGAALGVVSTGTRPVVALAFDGAAKRLAVGFDDGVIHVLAVDGSAPAVVLRGHEAGVFDLEFAPHEDRLASASLDTTVRVWDPTLGKELVVFSEPRGEVTVVAFTRDGTTLCAGGNATSLWHAPRIGEGEPR